MVVRLAAVLPAANGLVVVARWLSTSASSQRSGSGPDNFSRSATSVLYLLRARRLVSKRQGDFPSTTITKPPPTNGHPASCLYKPLRILTMSSFLSSTENYSPTCTHSSRRPPDRTPSHLRLIRAIRGQEIAVQITDDTDDTDDTEKITNPICR